MHRGIAIALLVCGVTGGVGLGQYAAPANAVKLTKFIMGVADLDKSVAFYQALGIELQGTVGKPAVLPENMLQLVDVPKGTKFRNAVLKIPGADFALELTEFSAMELHPGKERFQDPGAAKLILNVRDINVGLSAAKKQGAEVATTGGAPVTVQFNGRDGRAVTFKDPDGLYVEISQPPAPLPATTAPANSNIIGAWFLSSVENSEKSAAFYRDRFGFAVKVGDWTTQDMDNNGTLGAQRRRADLTIPGSSLRWGLVEFKDIDRKPYRLRIPDPGAPAIGLDVRDLDAASAAIKAAGGSVITEGGSIPLPNGGKLAFMRDQNGILLEVEQLGKK